MTSLSNAPLPEPDAEALAVSDALAARIRAEIDANGGWIAFERYMQMALYEPGLGYYSAGAVKFGDAGDFTTAPETSDWLARALAGFLAGELESLQSDRILELGAGSGALAVGLQRSLAGLGHASIDYAVLETSADLRARQETRLADSGFAARWLDALPDAPFRGIVLANEVADALPVARFVKRGGRALPLGVRMQGSSFDIVPGPHDARLAEAVAAIERALGGPLPDGYRSEVCLLLGPWLQAILNALEAGGLLVIDYGMPERDFYRAERSDGTLIGHYRQRAHDDLLRWPGLSDISAWVDFSAVARLARRNGFTLSGFTTQAQFLLESMAADDRLRDAPPTAAEAAAMRRLILPGEMGERFKLIWLTRGYPAGRLPGRDFRGWL